MSAGSSNPNPLNVLFLGAAFGVVLGMRIAAAGHKVTFACREGEAKLINDGRLFLRLPAKEPGVMLEIGLEHCSIAPNACIPEEAYPKAFDLVCLGMAEPQYSAPGIRELVERIAAAGTPCLSIMNMPLPPFLAKFTSLDGLAIDSIFTEAGLWAQLDPANFTMASADPQAIRDDTDDALVTSVTLPTNFKVGPFGDPRHQGIVERLASDIDASRIETGGGIFQPRVRLRPHPSVLVPLVKWPMLITGNFRCLTSGSLTSIAEAVCSNETESRDLYEWVKQVCVAYGSEESTMVPFDRYRAAAEGLTLPSSLARGLCAGATGVERVDILIQSLAAKKGMTNPMLDRIVTDVSAELEKNRARASGTGL